MALYDVLHDTTYRYDSAVLLSQRRLRNMPNSRQLRRRLRPRKRRLSMLPLKLA